MHDALLSQSPDYLHDLRRALLQTLGLLDSQEDAALDGLLRVALAISACPTAGLALVEGDRLFLRFQQGLPAQVLPREGMPLDELLRSGGWVERSESGYLAGVAVLVEGLTVALLYVADVQPRTPLSATARESLTALAVAIEALLIARRPEMDARVPAMRVRQQLLARVGQEMRTPLGALGHFTEQIRSLPTLAADPRIARWLIQADSAARQLHELTDELLELTDELLEATRLDAGRSLPRLRSQAASA